MNTTIALAGNPNCGKTTLFNDLTGSSQHVGNWPGVTVEKKEGRLRGRRDAVIQDLPGIMASRTIEQDRDRRMTIMTTGFIPCGAKMPVIGLFTDGAFGAVEDNNSSLLAAIGNAAAWIFYPLGWTGDMAWKATVASFTGLIAKENVVGALGTLYRFAGEVGENGEEIWALVGADFGALTAYSFMIFNLLCAPCFAAMGAIRREMNNPRWTAFAIGYMCLFAYVVSLIVYQLGGLIAGAVPFGLWSAVALALLAGILCLLFRKGRQGEERSCRLRSAAAAAK